MERGGTLKNIKGITFKQNGKIITTPERSFLDLNKLPYLPYHLLDIKNYLIKDFTKKTLDFITSRGCPHRCTFCYNTKFNKNTWRYMNASRVLEEVESLASNYDLEGIRFENDNFFVSKKRIEEICKGMTKLDLKWASNCRNDYLQDFNKKLLILISKSGCAELYLGAESGSQRILNLIKKDITIEDTKKAAIICKEYGIKPVFTFMIGFPTETKKDVQKTIQLIDKIKKINPSSEMGVYIYIPYPGTELYEFCKKYGFNEPVRLEEWGNFFWSASNIPWFDEDYKQFLEVISYVSWFALFHGLEARFKSKRLKLGIKILSSLAKLRWKYRLWKFPFELELAKWYYKRGIVE